MKNILIILILFTSNSCLFISPQLSSTNYSPLNYKNKYGAFIPSDEVVISSGYNFVKTKTVSGDFVSRMFYPEKNTLTKQVHYSDNLFKVKQGSFKWFYDNGKPWIE